MRYSRILDTPVYWNEVPRLGYTDSPIGPWMTGNSCPGCGALDVFNDTAPDF